ERPAATSTGLHVLHSLGYTVPESMRETVQLPAEIHELIQTTPIPRNMNPTARAKALQRIYGIHRKDVRYTDTAMYPDRSMAAVSVIGQDKKTLTTATMRTRTPAVVEEMAITIAIVANGPQHITILTDFQTAIRRFRAGRISPQAFHALQTKVPAIPKVALVWTRGHESVEGNRHAHAVARACTIRAPGADTTSPPKIPRLSKSPSPNSWHFNAASYPSLWACLSNPSLALSSSPSYKTWKAALLSPSPDDHQMLVQRAKAAAE
ncbi:hypothetical protein HPB47_007723, partial [Ixodes persulcatus]